MKNSKTYDELNFKNRNPTIVRDSEREINGLAQKVLFFRVVEILLLFIMGYTVFKSNFSSFYLTVLSIIVVEMFCSSLEKSIRISEELIENYLNFLKRIDLEFSRKSWIDETGYKNMFRDNYEEKSG